MTKREEKKTLKYKKFRFLQKKYLTFQGKQNFNNNLI